MDVLNSHAVQTESMERMSNNKHRCNNKQTTIVIVLRHNPKPIRRDSKSPYENNTISSSSRYSRNTCLFNQRFFENCTICRIEHNKIHD